MSSFSTLLNRYWLLLISVVAVITVAAFYTQPQSPTLYRASANIDARYSAVTPNENMNAASTLQAWITSPSTVTSLFQDTLGTTIQEKTKAFEIIPGPNNSSSFTLERSGTSKEDLEKQFSVLRTALTDSERKAPLDIISTTVSDPVVTKDKPALPLAPLAGIVAGMVLAGVIISLLERSRQK